MLQRADLADIQLPQPICEKITSCITKPIAGFEHKKNKDGSYFTLEQQIKASQEQVFLLARNHYAKGAREEDVLRIVSYFI